MKKIGKIISLWICSFILFANCVFAAGYDVTVTSNSVTIGNTVTLNIKVTDAAGKFTITSSDASIVSVSTGSAWIDNTNQSITLKANKVGTATINIKATDVTSYSGDNIGYTKSIKITVNPKPTVNNNTGGSTGNNGRTVTTTPKSSNNFLTSLTIDGLTLNEKFDKETLEYSVDIPAQTEKIKVNAQLADSSAKVSGTGEINVTSGLNTINVVVTAANGSKRTYTIKATVLELKPIEVTINKEKYTVVRSRKDLPEISEYFEDKNIKIGEDTVEGYYNQKLDYNLVGLKDGKGNIEYYIYKNNRYTLYKEYAFNGTVLQILDKELDNGYKKVSFIYGNDKINSYQEVKTDILKNTYALDNNDIVGNQFYLFYAKNVETGKEYLYQYDALEKTVQRYNLEVLDMYRENSNTYYMYLLISILVIGVLIITLSVVLIKKNKQNKPSENSKKKVKNKRKEIDDDDE